MFPKAVGVLIVATYFANTVDLVHAEEIEAAWKINQRKLILPQRDCLFLFGGAELIAVPEWKDGIEFEWQPIVYTGKEGGDSAELIVTFCAKRFTSDAPKNGVSLFLRANGDCSVVSTMENGWKELSRFSIPAWTSFGRWDRVSISTVDEALIITYDGEVVSEIKSFIRPPGHTAWSIEVPAPAVEAPPNSVMLRLLQQH